MIRSNPTISVVIPAYNEATYIDRLLKGLSRQKFQDFEVIVSDAESKDGTAKIVKDFQEKLNIKFVESPPRGPGAGRNFGAKHAKGEWLLFLDADDDIDDPNFIQVLLGETKKHHWHTSTAKMRMCRKPFALTILFTYQKLLSHTNRPIASGYCILANRSIFEKAGGFNENIQLGEDYEYVSRVGKYGFGFVNSTYYYVDPRRNKEEGVRLLWKGILNEIYRLIYGYKKLERRPIRYEFGKHQKRK